MTKKPQNTFEGEMDNFIDEDNSLLSEKEIFHRYPTADIYLTDDNKRGVVYFASIPYDYATAIVSFTINNGRRENLGICLSEQIRDNEVCLEYIETSKKGRGKGIGFSMIELLEITSKEKNVDKISGQMIPFGDSGQKTAQKTATEFYIRQGFNIDAKNNITKNIGEGAVISEFYKLNLNEHNQIVKKPLIEHEQEHSM